MLILLIIGRLRFLDQCRNNAMGSSAFILLRWPRCVYWLSLISHLNHGGFWTLELCSELADIVGMKAFSDITASKMKRAAKVEIRRDWIKYIYLGVSPEDIRDLGYIQRVEFSLVHHLCNLDTVLSTNPSQWLPISRHTMNKLQQM